MESSSQLSTEPVVVHLMAKKYGRHGTVRSICARCGVALRYSAPYAVPLTWTDEVEVFEALCPGNTPRKVLFRGPHGDAEQMSSQFLRCDRAEGQV